MPEATETQPSVSPAASEAGQLDHLAHLHRMSRTAGLGSSEYAAVNVAAVAAVVIGALSGLSLVTPIFLILPVAGVVIAAIAIKQIVSSRGTQTGLLLAVIGLLACFGFAGFTGYQKVQQDITDRNNRNDIDGLVVNFGQKIADKKYGEAMDLADRRWKEQVDAKKLETFFDGLTSAFGAIKDFKPTGLYDIQEDPETHYSMAVGMFSVDAEKTNEQTPVKTEIRFRNSGDGWKIYAIPQWFAPPAAPGAAKGAPQQPTGPAGPPAP